MKVIEKYRCEVCHTEYADRNRQKPVRSATNSRSKSRGPVIYP